MMTETEEEILSRFGLVPEEKDMPVIRQLLQTQIANVASDAYESSLIRLLCAQLFAYGAVEDSLLIWRAKTSNFDSMCGLDIQLMCGAGLTETRMYMETAPDSIADEARAYLTECEESGDFDDWSPEETLNFYRSYYHIT